MSTAGVVAALLAEARTLGPRLRRSDGLFSLDDGSLVAVSGMGGVAAATAAAALVHAGCGALVSWGMAGGLDPALRAGTICLPSVIVARDGAAVGTTLHWRESLTAAIAGGRAVVGGKLLSSDHAIANVAAKADAFRSTGAVAVDMESLAVAGVAARHELPFVAVRVIVDAAGDVVPPVVLASSVAGRVAVARLLLGMMRSPREIPPLLRLAQRYRAATEALAVVARTGALVPSGIAASVTTRPA